MIQAPGQLVSSQLDICRNPTQGEHLMVIHSIIGILALFANIID
jgi:hypothetical protein